MQAFDDQQKQWLQGFVSGLEARKAADRLAGRSAGAEAAPAPAADALQRAAQDRTVAAGGKLVPEETAKSLLAGRLGFPERIAQAWNGGEAGVGVGRGEHRTEAEL